LRISNALHQEANHPQYNTCDVAACFEGWLWVFGSVWGVDHGDWQADYPDPDHLEDPEPKEGQNFDTLAVEAVIFASLKETGVSEHDEGGVDDLTSMVMTGESRVIMARRTKFVPPAKSRKVEGLVSVTVRISSRRLEAKPENSRSTSKFAEL
jgi:hypothetical protein